MSRFYFEKQFDAMDCGVACIRMIAKHYGKEYSREYLSKKCFTSREGVSLMSINDTLSQIGFKTIGGKISLNKLTEEALTPCILHWSQNHYVVLYKISKSRLNNSVTYHIADPSTGLLSYDQEEFSNLWVSTTSAGEDKGIVLLCEPTPEFYQAEGVKTNRNSLKFLYSYIKKYKKLIVQLLIGLVLGSILQLIFPFLTQAIVDVGIKNKNIGFIYLILIAQLVIFISRTIVEYIRSWILMHISTRVNISLISDFLIKLVKLPMSYFDSKMLGDIIQRVDDHNRIENFLISNTLSLAFSLFNLIVFGIVLWIYSLKIFLIFLLGSTLYVAWIFIFLKKRRVLDFKMFEQRAMNQSLTYQLIHGMQEMKLQNTETRKRWEWEDIQADMFKINVATLSLEQKQNAGNVFINELKNIIISFVAATAVINGELTLGTMLAIQFIIGQLNSPIEQMVHFIQDVQDAKISLERINEIHDEQEENEGKEESPQNLSGKEISIKDLTFQYEGPYSPKVLNNINLTIPEGKVTAIVGASGSGKTTLIKMLLQYYNPVVGEITVGKHDILAFNSTWWRNQCGVVMQDGFLFNDSIARNIACSNEEIDIERLQYAAQISNIDEFVNSLPLKYNTKIGQDGQNISLGQKQRILIARAIYKKPSFIFLDEATNSLDANNEKEIVENLEEFYKGKTVIIVAHRLSTVKNADQIIVLDKGSIVEVGNHNELTVKKGLYYNLVKNQLELGN